MPRTLIRPCYIHMKCKKMKLVKLFLLLNFMRCIKDQWSSH